MKNTLAILLIIFFTQAHAQVGIITTIAGTGVPGYSGDGGAGTGAQLCLPNKIALYNSWLYISDECNHCVRRLDLETGIITTVAGTGVQGFSGDGGQATDAKLNIPQGLTVDKIGNLYISDGGNYRVRKVKLSTGVITTFAGYGVLGNNAESGPATDAEFKYTIGMCVDKSNSNLYITDYGNQKIRRVNFTTERISTFAGSGIFGYAGNDGPAKDAHLASPTDVCCDTAGNILIVESENRLVRRVNTQSGIITLFCGLGTIGYSGNGGPAKYAEMSIPISISSDKKNNIYITDKYTGTVRCINGATGIITTVAGTGIAGYANEGDPATTSRLACFDAVSDDYGNLIIADRGTHRILRVSSGVSVSDVHSVVDSKLYPNPTTGTFTIHTTEANALVTIYNITGTCIYRQNCTNKSTEVDICTQPPGMYMMYIKNGSNTLVSKILKQ